MTVEALEHDWNAERTLRLEYQAALERISELPPRMSSEAIDIARTALAPRDDS